MARSSEATEAEAHRIVSEHGPRWWNEHARRFPNSKTCETELRDEMARYCVKVALDAASAIDGDYNAGVEAALRIVIQCASMEDAGYGHDFTKLIQALEKLKRTP